MDYYDIDEILLHESKVKVEFKHKIYNFGFLVSQAHNSIPENKKVDAPYFLIEFLLKNDHCKLSGVPLDRTVLNDIRAKASIVDLRAICPYFFYLYSMLLEEKGLLAEFFYERMSEYFRFLMGERFSEDDVWRLDIMEKKLTLRGRRQFQSFRSFFVDRC